MKLYFLSGGKLDADRSVMHPGDDSGRRVTIPIYQVLIESGGRYLLVDTGAPPVAAGDSAALQREYDIDPSWIKPLIAPEERVNRQVECLGLELSDLDLVVNTHFHFDHAGGNRLFVGTTIAVQEDEIAAARDGEGSMLWDAPGLQFRTVQGDWSPLPGVEMLCTPGHTPGHQSMLVRLESGPWLFTFDAVYTEEHWRQGKLGAVQDVTQGKASVDRIRQVAARENARIVFGHDIAQWEALKNAPHFYS